MPIWIFVIHWIKGGKEYDYGFANTIINHLCTGSIGSRFILFVFHFGDSGAWPSGRPGILAFDAIDQSCHSESFILCQFSWFTLRSEEHTSELQSLMRISYAVF